MAIKWKVRQLAEQKGMNVSQLSEATGMAYSSALDYWHGNARRIDLRTMERLCKALECQPCELFDYQPGVTIEDSEDGPGSEDEVGASLIAGPSSFARETAAYAA